MWIENVIEQQYRIVKVLKKNEDKEIILLENKENHIRIICRKYTGEICDEVYEKLTRISASNLLKVYDVQKKENKTIVLEEYIDGISVAELLNDSCYTPLIVCATGWRCYIIIQLFIVTLSRIIYW